MRKLSLYIFFINSLLISSTLAKKSTLTQEETEEQEAVALEEKLTADAIRRGALRVGDKGILIPDASAEHPMIISNPEDQPLCKPKNMLTPSREINVMEGYELMLLANNIENPRKLIIDKTNHILVMSPGQGLYSIRMDDCANSNVQMILSNDKLDEPIGHGVGLFDNHIFVSTSNSIYKFPYSDGQHSPLENGVKIMTNINPKDSNATPDVAIDPFGYVFVPRSVREIHDKLDSSHAVIKKFNLRLIPEKGFDFEQHGEVQATGTNTHGTLGFDTQARLWGLNGITSSGEIKRADISEDRDLATFGLAEELNLYEFKARNYGFPYCMTEFDFKEVSAQSKGLGAQWAHPTFMNDSISLDEFCEEESNNQGPTFPLAPNSFATSVHFYMGTFCSVGDLSTKGSSVGLPCNWTDTPIIANHGVSGEPGGHSVIRLQFDDLGHRPRWDKQPDVLLQEAEPCSGSGCFSPYGLATDKYGRLVISSDETNEVFIMSRIYDQNAVKKLTDRLDAEDNKEDKGDKEDKEDDEEDEDDDDD